MRKTKKIEKKRKFTENSSDHKSSERSQKKQKTENKPPDLLKCLDKLSWLLESHPKSCTAVALVNNKLLIGDNYFNTKMSNKTLEKTVLPYIQPIINYFAELATGKKEPDIEKRKQVFKLIFNKKFSSELFYKAASVHKNELDTKLSDTVNSFFNNKKKSKELIKSYLYEFSDKPIANQRVTAAYTMGINVIRCIKKIERFILGKKNVVFNDILKKLLASKDQKQTLKIIKFEKNQPKEEVKKWLENQEKSGALLLLRLYVKENSEREHAETQIIDLLVIADLLTKETLEKNPIYIGISKTCCLHCHDLINATNEVLKDEFSLTHDSIKVTASHNRSFKKWLDACPIFFKMKGKALATKIKLAFIKRSQTAEIKVYYSPDAYETTAQGAETKLQSMKSGLVFYRDQDDINKQWKYVSLINEELTHTNVDNQWINKDGHLILKQAKKALKRQDVVLYDTVHEVTQEKVENKLQTLLSSTSQIKAICYQNKDDVEKPWQLAFINPLNQEVKHLKFKSPPVNQDNELYKKITNKLNEADKNTVPEKVDFDLYKRSLNQTTKESAKQYVKEKLCQGQKVTVVYMDQAEKWQYAVYDFNENKITHKELDKAPVNNNGKPVAKVLENIKKSVEESISRDINVSLSMSQKISESSESDSEADVENEQVRVSMAELLKNLEGNMNSFQVNLREGKKPTTEQAEKLKTILSNFSTIVNTTDSTSPSSNVAANRNSVFNNRELTKKSEPDNASGFQPIAKK